MLMLLKLSFGEVTIEVKFAAALLALRSSPNQSAALTYGKSVTRLILQARVRFNLDSCALYSNFHMLIL